MPMQIRIAKSKLNLNLSDIASSFGDRHMLLQFDPETQKINDWSLPGDYALMLEIRQEGENLVISTQHSKDQLIQKLKIHLTPQHYQQLRTAFSGTELELPVRSVSEERLEEEKRQFGAIFTAILTIGQPEKQGRFTPEEAHLVRQGEYAITTESSDYPIIGTYAAADCVIICLYNVPTHTALLAHVDGITTLSSLDLLIHDIGPGQLRLHLAGGTQESIKLIKKIVQFFISKSIEITSTDLVGDGDMGKSLAIDARTGDVFTSFQHTQLRCADTQKNKPVLVTRELGFFQGGKIQLSKVEFEPRARPMDSPH